MFKIRYALEADSTFWFALDKHICKEEFERKVRDRRAYIICDGDRSIGVMRYNLFWDSTPFLTLIYMDDSYRGKAFGTKAMLLWEKEMCELGYKIVMTSTQADESAQHFYRKLGYIEKGSLCFDNTPIEQPLEMIFVKTLNGYRRK